MFDRFLIPLDGSELAEKAAAPAAELARQCSAQIVLVRVCNDQASLAESVDYLERVSQAAEEEGLSIRCDVYIGEPAARIVQAAYDEKVDLIIMSSHGRTGEARTVFGSVAETVMRLAPCPVMVVKSHQPFQDDGIKVVAVA